MPESPNIAVDLSVGRTRNSVVDGERRAYVHETVDNLDRSVTNLAELASRMEDRLQQVLRQDMPNSVMGDGEKAVVQPPDVPLANRLGSIAAQAEVAHMHLQSLLDRLEV